MNGSTTLRAPDHDWVHWDEHRWPAEPQATDDELTRLLARDRKINPPGIRARMHRPVQGVRHLKFDSDRRYPYPRLWFSNDGEHAHWRDLHAVRREDLIFAHPTRDFSRRKGQKNKPIARWAETNEDLITCESQWEGFFVLLADWDQRVRHISAQPFTLEFPRGALLHLHTPDFVLLTDDEVPIVVDIKTPEEALTESWCRRAGIVAAELRHAGMLHLTFTGMPRSARESLSEFSSARPDDEEVERLREPLRDAASLGATATALASMAAAQTGVPYPEAMSVIRRLLWLHQLHANLAVRFTEDSLVWAA